MICNNRWPLLLGCALALAGCAMPPVAPVAGSQFDGIYTGQDSLVNGVVFQCGLAAIPETFAISSGRFDYPFQVSPPRTAPLPVQVFADGTVYGRMMYGTEEQGIQTQSRFLADWVVLQGHITGTTLGATITNLRCARRLTVQKTLTP